MKKIIVRIPEKLAHEFKVMCAVLKTTQGGTLQKFIEAFLKDNKKDSY